MWVRIRSNERFLSIAHANCSALDIRSALVLADD